MSPNTVGELMKQVDEKAKGDKAFREAVTDKDTGKGLGAIKKLYKELYGSDMPEALVAAVRPNLPKAY